MADVCQLVHSSGAGAPLNDFGATTSGRSVQCWHSCRPRPVYSRSNRTQPPQCTCETGYEQSARRRRRRSRCRPAQPTDELTASTSDPSRPRHPLSQSHEYFLLLYGKGRSRQYSPMLSARSMRVSDSSMRASATSSSIAISWPAEYFRVSACAAT